MYAIHIDLDSKHDLAESMALFRHDWHFCYTSGLCPDVWLVPPGWLPCVPSTGALE